jgi:hypothetical protein
MQPTLNETAGIGGPAQRVFQGRQRADHANKGFAGDEQNGKQMRQAKPEIAHETQSYPCTDPDQRKTPDHKQRKQEMDDKYEISQRHGYANGFGKAKE